jgi:predicted ferric reductase
MTAATRTRPSTTRFVEGRSARSWWPDLLGTAAIGSVVIVVALWLHGGNVADLGAGIASALTSIGRLTGLVAADLLLIQVLLMARIPWIERSFGQDHLARWHRIVGFTSIDLMLAHVILITLGYAGSDHAGLLIEAWRLTTTYPGMLIAVAGTAALIMVAVTSVRIARARLRYESWHLLHLYAYLGVGLSLPHEIWTGVDFTSTAAARLYWWTVYIAAAGCVLLFRVGVPVWRTLRHDLRITKIVPESPGVTSIYLRGRDVPKLRAVSGQFFHWRFLGVPGWTRAHPYSLSAAPRPDLLRITVKALGDGSADVARLRPGMRAMIEGPYGRLTGAVRTRTHLTFLACGIGITPLRAMLESEPFRPGEAVLIYRASGPEDFTFHRELQRLVQLRGVVVHYLGGPRRDATSWLPVGHRDDVATLRALAPYVAHSDVYMCGPAAWMDSVAVTLDRAGVSPEHVHSERFEW